VSNLSTGLSLQVSVFEWNLFGFYLARIITARLNAQSTDSEWVQIEKEVFDENDDAAWTPGNSTDDRPFSFG
jgi:hypothetical protein